MIKLPRHVYSPDSEASVSNDGKIPGFCKFLFLSSVIKFDNEMSEVKNKDHNRPTLVYAKSKFTLQDAFDVIYHQVISSFWKWQLLYYSSALQFFTDFGAHFVETQPRFQQACEPFLLTEQY